MRFTLDSNILVRALASPTGPALRVLERVLDDHILVLSRFILDEVERVLQYPRLQGRYQITAKEASRFTGRLADAAHLVEPVIVRPLVLSDPADDPVLYTAADGKADILCTRNTRHFDALEVQAFCVAHHIRVMTDLDVLREFFERGRRAGWAARSDSGNWHGSNGPDPILLIVAEGGVRVQAGGAEGGDPACQRGDG